MPRLFRRQFVQLRAISTSAGIFTPLLTSCSENARRLDVTPLLLLAKSTTGPLYSETNVPDHASPKFDLVVARDSQPEYLVCRAIAAFGGMGEFVQPEPKVVIKPNICTGYHGCEHAATTHP